jgi:hypothetical protein
MDGKVLHEVFRSPRDVSYVADELDESDLVDDITLSEDEAAQVEERLRSLGYL